VDVRRARRRSRAPTALTAIALLQALFPGGIPANEDTIRSLNAWLDEAERIARSR